MELTEKQMKTINGGVAWALITGIGTAVVFVIGILSGYTNPSRCNN